MAFLVATAVHLGVAVGIGLIVGRWFVVPVLTLLWPVYLLGVWQGAWGHGFGDEWQWVFVFSAASFAGSTAGVVARRHLAAGRESGG